MDNVVVDDVAPHFEDIPDIPVSTVTINSVDIPDSVVVETSGEAQLPRRRGRPRGSKNRPKVDVDNVNLNTGVKGRIASDVAIRGQKVLTTLTGVPAIWRPHIQMTDDEAKDIAEPAASFAVRKAETSELVEDFLDNFDVIAVIMGCTKYVVRVIKEEGEFRREEESTRVIEARRVPMERVRRTTETPRQQQATYREAEANANGSQANTEFDSGIQSVSAPYTGEL
jgi:hypothetical protein